MNDYPMLRLGDIVKPIQDRRVDRTKWLFDKYVAGQHIDSGEVRIKKYSLIEGNEEVIGPAFHMLFRPGHVLYSTRRAYLRKAGIVNFEGVCSNVTLVLQANEAKLLQSLLPFILQSEDFVQFAIGHSVGSTNPFVKWSDLAKYKILVPPLAIQKKISQILWAIENNIEKTENLIQVAEKLKKGLLEELLTKGIGHKKFKKTELGEIPTEWELKKFSEVIKINPESLTNKTEDNYELEYIDISSIDGPNVIQKTEKYQFANAPSRARRIIRKEDVIISTVRPYLKAFALIGEDKKNLICSTGFAVLRKTDLIAADYIFQYCLSELFQHQSNVAMVGSNYPSLNNDAIENFLIPLPQIEEQREIICLLKSADKLLKDFNSNLENLANLKKKLSNSFLSGELIISKEAID